MSTAPAISRLAAVGATIVQFASTAHAQRAPGDTIPRLRGQVVEDASALPVPAADVWIISADVHTATDSAGAFQIGIAAGKYLVEVRRLGFLALRDTVTVTTGQETVKRFGLVSSTAHLDTVRTLAGRQQYISPRLRGFEERRLAGQGGHFISDSTLRKNEGATFVELVAARMPGLFAVQLPYGGGKAGGRYLVSARTQCRGGFALIDPPGTKTACRMFGGNDCYVTIRLDGNVFYTARMAEEGVLPPDLTKILDVTSIAGIEFYAGSSSAPGGMYSSDQGCGTLWVWTREK